MVESMYHLFQQESKPPRIILRCIVKRYIYICHKIQQMRTYTQSNKDSIFHNFLRSNKIVIKLNIVGV